MKRLTKVGLTSLVLTSVLVPALMQQLHFLKFL